MDAHSLLVLFVVQFIAVESWPDGSPCIYAAYDDMNPLEAVEHQGGLQLSTPPFFIEVEQSCYWFNQPVEITLQGNTTKDQFRGFAIQPFVMEGTKAGKRIGQFLRLDDNGSWRQQCFQKKDSVTHSHDELKKKMKLWWKNDEDEQSTVQFVATVVIALRQFWVKSVLSRPIPPCRQQHEIVSWQRPPITAPPPVDRFKIDTFRMFNQQNSEFLASLFANERPAVVPVARPLPTIPQPTFTAPPPTQTHVRTPIVTNFRPNPFIPQQPRPAMILPQQRPQPQQQQQLQTFTSPVPQITQRQRLTHVIPLPNMISNPRPNQFNARPFLVSSSTSPNRQQPAFPRQVAPQLQCFDREPANLCFGWIQFCRASSYMQSHCARTCRRC